MDYFISDKSEMFDINFVGINSGCKHIYNNNCTLLFYSFSYHTAQADNRTAGTPSTLLAITGTVINR